MKNNDQQSLSRLIIDDNMLHALSKTPKYSEMQQVFEHLISDPTDRGYVFLLAYLQRKMSQLAEMNELLSKVFDYVRADIADPFGDIPTEKIIDFYTASVNQFSVDLALTEKVLSKLNEKAAAEGLSSFLPSDIHPKDIPAGSVVVKYFDAFAGIENVGPPRKSTEIAEGYDVALPMEVELPRHVPVIVPLGLILQPQPGFHVEIRLRGWAAQMGIILTPSPVIVEADFCGPDDIAQVTIINMSEEPVLRLLRHSRIFILRVRRNTSEIYWTEQKSRNFSRQPSRGSTGSSNFSTE